MTELAHRNHDQVDVSLVWDRPTDDLFVVVADGRTGVEFTLPAARDRALDVYYHPFAYGALRDD
jgi:hypothetical protein